MLRNRLNTYTRVQQIRSYASSLTYFLILVNNTAKITEIACPENNNRHQDTPEVIITATVKATQGGAAATKITKERQKFEVTRQLKGN